MKRIDHETKIPGHELRYTEWTKGPLCVQRLRMPLERKGRWSTFFIVQLGPIPIAFAPWLDWEERGGE